MLIYGYKLNEKRNLNIMDMLSFISVIAFIATVILFIVSKKIGKIYLLIGFETLIMMYLYVYLPSVIENIKNMIVFLIFSLMILIASQIVGIGTYIFTKNDKFSIIISLITSTVIILILFNIKGMISYLYIPVLMFKLQEYINNSIELPKN